MHRRLRGPGLFLGLVALGLLTVGCGGGGGRPLKVSGKLLWSDGSAVSGATVKFVSASEGGHDAAGFTGPDGEFDLTTYNSGDGALPGEYKVLVTRPEVGKEQEVPMGPGQNQAEMMKKYFSKKASKQGRETIPTGKDAIPAAYAKADTTTLRWTISSGNTSPELKLQKNK